MDKEMLIFNGIAIDKHKFKYPKNPIRVDNVDIDKMISKKVSFGKESYKCFIGYKDNEKVILFHIILLKITIYENKIDDKTHSLF